MVTEQECIFCKLVRNEIPSKKIYDDKDVMAFLDINPASIGHSMIIPKKHFANLHEIDDHTLGKVMGVAKIIAERAMKRLAAQGVNILQSNGRHAGQIIDHMHVHVIPRYDNDNIMLRFPRAQLSEEDMKKIQDKMKEEDKKDYDAGTNWV